MSPGQQRLRSWPQTKGVRLNEGELQFWVLAIHFWGDKLSVVLCAIFRAEFPGCRIEKPAFDI